MNMNQAIKKFRESLACHRDCVCLKCTLKHVSNGCHYGLADGGDDYFKECDCGE